MTSEKADTRILVVDDERGLRDLISDILAADGHEVDTARDGGEALARLGEQAFSLVISDLRMPGMDGLALLAAIRERWPAMPVIILTAFGTIPEAVEAIRRGAFDFVEKPVRSPKAMRGLVRRALGAARRPTAPRDGDLPAFVCEDPRSEEVREMLHRVAGRDTTVLLTGESGTGKEVAARLLHALSPRAGAPFVAVNVAAIPETLLEDELFGHVRGAFTGADRGRPGVFEAADGGTLFLDEIGEMGQDLQARLLRVLETQSFTPLGSTRTVEVDVRLVAATNQDLHAEVRAGRFRQDLYYRLGVFPVHLPPLRERLRDVVPLARRFLDELGAAGRTLSAEDESRLLSYSWPGNVRELRNVIERALVLSPDGELRLPELSEPEARVSETGPPTLKEMERQAVVRALERAGGNRRKAAAMLGISLRNLQYKIKRYGLKTK
jgi:DNA-binding NtrC family response regulator